MFFGIIPLVIPALVMLIPALKQSPRGDGVVPSYGPRSRAWPMTIAAGSAAAGAGLLLYGIDQAHLTPAVSLPLGVLGLGMLGYGLYRLLPPHALVFARGLPTTIMMRGMFSGAFFGVNAFIPLALTDVKGFSVSQAGLALTTGALGWSAGSYLQSVRDGDASRRIRLGAACVMAGVLLTALSVLPGSQLLGWAAVPAWIVAGFGMGIGMTTVSVTALKQSPVNEQGANSAALSVTDMLGSALTIGIGGALVNLIGHDQRQIAVGFVVIVGCMGALGLAATLLAGRTRTPQ